jgi:hypothetical protein
VNSQELELSLRTEFENYFKNALAESQEELARLKEKIDADFEKQKEHVHELLSEAVKRTQNRLEFEPGFAATVVEHLRLARDEGARITATAFAETEDLARASAANSSVKELSEAISEISSKTTQSEILKSLVNHASKFAPRGAFFIVKSDRFVGWKAFGEDDQTRDDRIQNIYLPVRSRSILSESLNLLSTLKSSEIFPEDRTIFERLNFENQSQMIAIPLIARGRGVAVLYADDMGQSGKINSDALETLLRVTGLTVEVLASSKGAPKRETKKPAPAFSSEVASQPRSYEESRPVESSYAPPAYSEPATQAPEYSSSYQQSERMEEKRSAFEETPWAHSGDVAVKEGESEAPLRSDYQSETPREEFPSQSYQMESADEYRSDSFRAEPQSDFGFRHSESAAYSEPIKSDYEIENFRTEVQPIPQPAENFAPVMPPPEPAVETFDFRSFQTEMPAPMPQAPVYVPEAPVNVPEAPVVATPPAPAVKRSRLSDRNVDLPIQVSEDERRFHNDARRFARLLVSEIKLYNEQKVREGRDSSDIYERLREAIDRSREMYDKRIQAPVASKFDYFHYEMVNTLAEGDASRLGASYPGPMVG